MFQQVLRISDAKGPAFRDELRCQTCEIFHIRPKDYRLPCANCFDRVLTTMRSETFPDKNNRRDIVPGRQLTSCVDEQAISRLDGTLDRIAPDCPQIASA